MNRLCVKFATRNNVMTDNIYANEIRKTGFVLEYQVADLFRESGWTVISNKYYEDDLGGSVREIDLLAYRVKKVQQLDVYTTLLISCKKSDSDVWALVAKEINLKDPNADRWPLHAWSNDKAIVFQLARPSASVIYHKYAIRFGVKEALSDPDFEVFAFQEMNRVSGAPKNDKNIFNAVTSLMKAQAYELGALSQRKKHPSVYQFNLLSVVDSDLVRLVINKDAITQETVDSEHYISRYIIKKKETFSRIRFLSFKKLKDKIDDYTRLHEANCSWFNEAIDIFYDQILSDYTRSNILLDDFRSQIWWVIYWPIKNKFNITVAKENIHVGWIEESMTAKIEISCDEISIDHLNENPEIKIKVRSVLKNIYRYDGDFVFEINEFPF